MEGQEVTFVWITFTFEANHRWPKAPLLVKFLRSRHRHTFHVRMKWPVRHDDRDIEFISKKWVVQDWVAEHWDGRDLDTKSCEMMAEDLATRFKASYVSVSEDNENGAEVHKVWTL